MPVPWSEIVSHRERLLHLAARRCPTREDAEDVVHEAMLRCATFEDLDPARLAQFLTAVTIRLCADVYRGAERGARVARSIPLAEVPTPEELACAAADAEEIRSVLSALPSRQRDVLVDRAAGMSVAQISERRALTYKATESALSRARSTMRLALAAGLSFLGAAVLAVRRRPVAAVALPLAAVSLVVAVHHAPVRPVPAPAPYAGPVGIDGETVGLDRRPLVRRPVPEAVRAGTVTNAPAARRVRPAQRPPGKPEPREIAGVDHPLVKGRITQEGSLVDDANRCLTAERYSLHVEVDPWRETPRFVVKPKCHPRTHGGTT